MPGRAEGPFFLIITEDGAANAPRTIEALFRAMCRVSISGFDDRQLGRECFEPPEGSLREVLSGNRWKSRQPRDRASIINLAEVIAGHLVRPKAFVLFHFDGDRAHSQRSQSENVNAFETRFRSIVEQMLMSPPLLRHPVAADVGSRAPRRRLSEAEVQEAMGRLIPLTPFSCVEAWTYYNTQRLRSLCPPHHHAIIEEWERAPGATEELERPWDKVSAGKAHNRVLAEEGFPARRALEAKKSFADTVDSLRSNTQLMASLSPLTYR
jgi:hypothetical protein